MLSGRFRSVVPLGRNRLLLRLMEITPSSGVPVRPIRTPASKLNFLHTCFAWRGVVASRSSAALQRLPSHHYCSAGRLRALGVGGAEASSVVIEHDENDAAPVIDIPSYCSGCGVKLQKDDTDAPGYFQLPKKILQVKENAQVDDGLEFEEDGPFSPEIDSPRPATSDDAPPAEPATSSYTEVETAEAAWAYNRLVEDGESWEVGHLASCSSKLGSGFKERKALQLLQPQPGWQAESANCTRMWNPSVSWSLEGGVTQGLWKKVQQCVEANGSARSYLADPELYLYKGDPASFIGFGILVCRARAKGEALNSFKRALRKKKTRASPQFFVHVVSRCNTMGQGNLPSECTHNNVLPCKPTVDPAAKSRATAKRKMKVRSLKAEAALPEFDLGRKVGRKIALQKFRRPVILCVIDLADFDGSIPRLALGSLLPRSMHERTREWQKRDESARPVGWNADHKGGSEECRLVLVANKSDLLPRLATKTRLEAWVRHRAVQAGLPRPDLVHLVSSTKQMGVGDLLKDLHKLAGPAGDVWVEIIPHLTAVSPGTLLNGRFVIESMLALRNVGAQNAGKSSLINAMRRSVGRTSPKKDVTTAALPGTTLGMLRIDGIMRGRCRMFDTPGVPHNYQLTSRLSPDEVRLLLPRGRLTPRTFRLGAGQTVFVGGVLRLDAVNSSASDLYFTVWASADIPCHFGKTETADERYTKMAGSALIPPLGDSNRLQKLGPLLPADVEVSGRSFKASSMDVAVAGLGWIAVAVSGKASLRAWTHHGVAVTVREALIPDLASELERPGLGNRTRQPPRAAKRKIK